MMTEIDIEVDGRTLHAYDSGPVDGLPVFWHHGTPGTGATPPPLLVPGVRLLSHDRPGYGGSTAQPGRTIAALAHDVAALADALNIARFGVIGASGGGPHTLACAAELGDRVFGAVALASPAPFDAEGLDWYGGMAEAGAAELRAAAAGREPLRDHLSTAEFDPDVFTPTDHAALAGPWRWLGGNAGQAMQDGQAGMIDDDLALVMPWGFVPERIESPVLLMHGELDRMVPVTHGKWLAEHCAHAELKLFPGDGHVSVLTHTDVAFHWLGELAAD